MHYRTKTYIAGEWTGDIDLIETLYKWNNNKRLNLEFSDAHELISSRDSSFPCSIKHTLYERLNRSKTFILIIGKNTSSVTKGACRYCKRYSSIKSYCKNGNKYDNDSFIQYECKKAIEGELKIIIIYNYTYINKNKCPPVIRDYGIHIAAKRKNAWGDIVYNYDAIKNAIMN